MEVCSITKPKNWLLSYLILWSHFVRSLFAYPARFITCWDLLYKWGWGGLNWVLRVDPSSQVEINNHWDTTPTPQKLLQRLGWLNKLLNQPDFSRQTVNDNNYSSDGHQQKHVKFRQAPKQESLCSWHKDVLDQTDVSPSYHLRVKRVGPKTYIYAQEHALSFWGLTVQLPVVSLWRVLIKKIITNWKKITIKIPFSLQSPLFYPVKL